MSRVEIINAFPYEATLFTSAINNQETIDSFLNAEPNFEVEPFKGLYQFLYASGFIADGVKKIQGTQINVESYDNSVLWLVLNKSVVDITMKTFFKRFEVPAGSLISTMGKVDKFTIYSSELSNIYLITKAKFTLTKKLVGKGGYGAVYRACMDQNCDFVYKRYFRPTSPNHFKEEVKISRIFSQNNIGPKVYDIIPEQEIIISEKLVQDFSEYSVNFIGKNFDDPNMKVLSIKIKPEVSIFKIDLNEVPRYAPMIQKCNTLYQNIQKIGCHHSDFKRNNIMLNQFGELRAIDFDPNFVSCSGEIYDFEDFEPPVMTDDFFEFYVREKDFPPLSFNKNNYLVEKIQQGSIYSIIPKNLEEVVAVAQYLLTLKFEPEFPLLIESDDRYPLILWAETQDGRGIGFSLKLLHRERKGIKYPSDISKLVDVIETLHYRYLNQTIDSMKNVDLKALETSCGIFNQYEFPEDISPDPRCYQYYYDNLILHGNAYINFHEGSITQEKERSLIVKAVEKRYTDVIRYLVESNRVFNYDKAIEKAMQLGYNDILEYLNYHKLLQQQRREAIIRNSTIE